MKKIDIDELQEIKENIIKRDIMLEMKSAIIEQVKKEILDELKKWIKQANQQNTGAETKEVRNI